MFGPTRQFGQLDGLLGPTRLFGELEGLLDLILPFGGLDFGVSLSGICCPGLRASFLEGLSCKSLSDLLQNLIYFFDFYILLRIIFSFFLKKTFLGNFLTLILS